MKDRRKHDRRQGDRRDTTNPPKQSSASLGILVLCCALAVTGVWFWAESESAVKENQGVVTRVQKQKQKVMGNLDYQAFREEVLRRDRDLIAKHKAKKESRRKKSPQVNPEQFRREKIQKQIAGLEAGLELHKNSSTKKGTIGWGIRQDLKKLRSESPAL